MKEQEKLRDDFISNLIKQVPLEEPSGEFEKSVMEKVRTIPSFQPRKRSFLFIVKSVFPWVLLLGGLVVLYKMFNIPVNDYTYTQHYLRELLIPSINIVFDSFRELASGKFYSIFLVVVVCGGLLFGIERIINNRSSAHRHYLI